MHIRCLRGCVYVVFLKKYAIYAIPPCMRINPRVWSALEGASENNFKLRHLVAMMMARHGRRQTVALGSPRRYKVILTPPCIIIFHI